MDVQGNANEVAQRGASFNSGTRNATWVVVLCRDEVTNLVSVVGRGGGEFASVGARLNDVQGCTCSVVVMSVELGRDILVSQELAHAHIDGDLARSKGLVEHVAHAIGGGAGAARAIDNNRRRVCVAAGAGKLAVASQTNGETTVGVWQFDIGLQI